MSWGMRNKKEPALADSQWKGLHHGGAFHVSPSSKHPVRFQGFGKKPPRCGAEAAPLESIEVVIHGDKANRGCASITNMINRMVKKCHANAMFTIRLLNSESGKYCSIAIDHFRTHTADYTTIHFGYPVSTVKFFHRTSDSGFDDKTIDVGKMPPVRLINCKVHSSLRLQSETPRLRVD